MQTFAIPTGTGATIISAPTVQQALNSLEIPRWYGKYYILDCGYWWDSYHF